MKTLIRTLVMLGLIVWLGAEIFFPVVAAVTFGHISDTHVAGSVIGALLRILHGIGLVSGIVLLALLALGPAWGIYRGKPALAAMALVLAMVGLTAYSQYGIIPAMERDRIAAGGAIDAVAPDAPPRVDFNHLHVRSTRVEGAVVLLGLVAVVLLAAGTEIKPKG